MWSVFFVVGVVAGVWEGEEGYGGGGCWRGTGMGRRWDEWLV